KFGYLRKALLVKSSRTNFNGLLAGRWTPRTFPRPFSHRSVQGGAAAAKRFIDVGGAALGLIVLSPLFVLIAAAVKLTDRGPIFYRQTRVGLDGGLFEIFKFRTMRDGAERDLGAVWSVQRDPRCTKVGGLLRRFGLDELPQLWNILR